MSEGAIYTDWIEGKFDKYIPSVYGMDYGYFPDPLALVEVAVNKKLMKLTVNVQNKFLLWICFLCF